MNAKLTPTDHRLTTRLPKYTYETLLAEALLRGRSLNAVVVELLDGALEETRRHRATSELRN